MLDAGDPAPDFDLPRPTAEGSETFRLSAALRDGPVVLAFYPAADTDGAAGLLSELAAIDWASVTDSIAILGVGVGGLDDYERLDDAVDVPFPLLLDPDGYFADKYGVLEPVDEETVRVRPSVFVVDQNCFVEDGWSTGPGEDPLSLDTVRQTVEWL